MGTTYGDSFFDGPAMQAAKGPLLGGGLAKLTSIAVRKFVPSYAKYAGLAGTIVGGGVSVFLMTKPQHKETGAAGLATALLVGLSEQLESMMGIGLKGDDDLSAYTSEMGAYTSEMGANALELMGDSPVQIEDGGQGTMALEAYTSEMGATPEGIQIQGGLADSFGSSF